MTEIFSVLPISAKKCNKLEKTGFNWFEMDTLKKNHISTNKVGSYWKKFTRCEQREKPNSFRFKVLYGA